MIKNIIATIIIALGSFHTFAHGQTSFAKTESQIYKVCEWNADTAVHIRQLQHAGIKEDDVRSRMILRLNSITVPEGMEVAREKMIEDTQQAVTIIYTFPEMFEDLDDTSFFNEIYQICDKETRK